MGASPHLRVDRVDDAVDEILSRVGRRLVVGTPLGVGKPNQLVNALYRRAQGDPTIELSLVTALSLSLPKPDGELERRLVKPVVERLFGAGYPDLEYVLDRRAGTLPENVVVHEFYVEPGRELDVARTQQSHISANFTDVLRDLEARGVNVLMQLVAGPETVEGEACYSLSSNPDLGLDLLDAESRRRAAGCESMMVLGQVNRRLPFMAGDAAVAADRFDVVVDSAELDFLPFAPPNEPVSTVDAWIGLYASTLVRDGGSLQLGIGALGDAIAELLRERHQKNDRYRRLVERARVAERYQGLVEGWGGLDPFAEGLYAPSEMLVPGFLPLYRAGILKRRVYPDLGLQRALDADRRAWDSTVSADLVRVLLREGAMSRVIDPGELERWQRLGVLADDLELEGGRLRSPSSGLDVPADLSDDATLERVTAAGLGESLRRGRVAHAGFFLGPRDFYEALRTMTPEERDLFEMTRISFVNQLHGGRADAGPRGSSVGHGSEELKRAQRRHARFLNTGLVATLGGAVASDGLDDGRVLSGVGGQFDFVAMANALEDGRSILMIRSVREKGRAGASSNVRFIYGHTTVPRAMRDIVVTEYGVADLRGRDDREVALALLAITDSRFQEPLLAKAKRAGKVRKTDRIADRDRHNLPQRLEEDLRSFREEGMLPTFPFGSDLSEVEVTLARALRGLSTRLGARRVPLPPSRRALGAMVSPPAAAAPYLERMGLDGARSVRERLLRATVLWALVEDGAV